MAGSIPARSPPTVRSRRVLPAASASILALLGDPSRTIVYSTNPLTAAGDTTRSDFILTQLPTGTYRYSPQTGIGTTGAPFTGTLTNFAKQFISQQGEAATAAKQLADGQDVVLNTLQNKVTRRLGRQYRRRDGASAGAAKCLFRQRARDVFHQADVRHADPGHVRISCLSMALAAGHPISGPRSSSSAAQLNDLTQQLASGKISTTYAGQGANRGFALSLRAQVSSIDAYRGHRDQRQYEAQRRQPGAAGHCPTSARRSRARPARRPSCSTTTVRPPARSRRRRRSRMRCRCSTASRATAICFPAAPPTRRRRCRPTSCSTAWERRPG